jgi:hypothetical protein
MIDSLGHEKTTVRHMNCDYNMQLSSYTIYMMSVHFSTCTRFRARRDSQVNSIDGEADLGTIVEDQSIYIYPCYLQMANCPFIRACKCPAEDRPDLSNNKSRASQKST